jgi:hypothetical protein
MPEQAMLPEPVIVRVGERECITDTPMTPAIRYLSCTSPSPDPSPSRTRQVATCARRLARPEYSAMVARSSLQGAAPDQGWAASSGCQGASCPVRGSIFGVAAAVDMDAVGRQLKHAVRQRGQEMAVVRAEQRGPLELRQAAMGVSLVAISRWLVSSSTSRFGGSYSNT